MKSLNHLKVLFYNIIHNQNNLLSKIIIFLITLLILSSLDLFQPNRFRYPVKLGEVLKKNIIANRDLKYIDKHATEKRRNLIKATTSPVYIYEKENIDKTIQEVRFFIKTLLTAVNYTDIKKYFKKFNISLTPVQFQQIKDITYDTNDLLNTFEIIIPEILKIKYIDTDEIKLFKYELSGIKVGTYEQDQLKTTLFLVEEIDNKNTIKSKIENIIINNLQNLTSTEQKLFINILHSMATPNLTYDQEISEFELSNRLKTEAIVYKKIKKDEIIARKGEKITDKNFEQIQLIFKDNKNTIFDITKISSTGLFFFIILIFVFYFITIFQAEQFKDFRHYLFVTIILIINVLIFSIPQYLGYEKEGVFYGLFLPISAFSLAFLFLYSRAFAAFISIILSIILYYITDFNHNAFLFIFFSCIASVVTLAQINRRLDLLKAGLKLSIINMIISLILYLNNNDTAISHYIILSIGNGVLSSILAIGLILLGENSLNTPTLFKLQELADFSNPLLKQLFNSAIGTYNHSIIVGNIAESAALEIGGNGFLAKVGGYYHDIGKVDNPEYFIENQSDFNKHDTIKPTISVAIIKAHVKIGVEKARKARLPQKVIDIISQHHGNSLIKYFYEEAKKNNSPDKEEIQKINFQYQNQNPQFPEAAVVLLADQVEAATRALKKYTTTNIEKLIEKLIDDKFQEGILDDSGLTLKDITRIQKIFCKVITGMYHPRIEYPSSTLKETKK